jgi:hypothetical protein
VIETLICGLLTCAQNKKDILGTNSRNENLCKGIKEYGEYKQTTLCIYQQEELTESDYTNQKRQQTFRV